MSSISIKQVTDMIVIRYCHHDVNDRLVGNTDNVLVLLQLMTEHFLIRNIITYEITDKTLSDSYDHLLTLYMPRYSDYVLSDEDSDNVGKKAQDMFNKLFSPNYVYSE